MIQLTFWDILNIARIYRRQGYTIQDTITFLTYFLKGLNHYNLIKRGPE